MKIKQSKTLLTKNTEELKTQTPILLHKTIQVLKEHKSEINPKYSAFIDKIDPFAPVNINENFINNILKYAIEKDFNCNE